MIKNKIVLAISDDQEQTIKLFKLLAEKDFQYQLFGEAIILEQKQYQEKKLIYIPYITYQDQEFIIHLSKRCNLLSIIVYLRYSDVIQQNIQNIITKFQYLFSAEQLIFYIYDSPQNYEQNYYHKQLYFNLENLSLKQIDSLRNFTIRLLEWNNSIVINSQILSQQKLTVENKEEVFNSYVDKFIDQNNNLRQDEIITELLNSNLLNQLCFDCEKKNQCYLNLIDILGFCQKCNYNKTVNRNQNLKYCRICQQLFYLNKQMGFSLRMKDCQKEKFEGNSTFKCQSGHQLEYLNYDILYEIFKLKLLCEYSKLLSNKNDNQSQQTKGVLVLRMESFGINSLMQRVYQNLAEQDSTIEFGEDVDNSFYLISTPDFMIESDDDKIKVFETLVNQNKIYAIIFCLSYQRTDLMKKLFFEMYKLLSQLNKLQMGVFIIQYDQNQKIDETVLEQFKCFISNIDIIYSKDSRDEIVAKIKKIIPQNEEDFLDFSNTIFCQQNEDEQYLIDQLNENVNQAEKASIKELQVQIKLQKEERTKQEENCSKIKDQIQHWKLELEKAQRQLQQQNLSIQINETNLKKLEQYQAKKQQQQSNVIQQQKKREKRYNL